MGITRQGAVGAAGAIVGLVVPMMWPTIPTPLGIALLLLAAALLLYAVASWCWERRIEAVGIETGGSGGRGKALRLLDRVLSTRSVSGRPRTAAAVLAETRRAKIAAWRAMAREVQKQADESRVARQASGDDQPDHEYLSQQLEYRTEYDEFRRAYHKERNSQPEYKNWLADQAKEQGGRRREFESWGHGQLMGSMPNSPYVFGAPVYELLKNIDRLEKWWALDAET